MNIQEKKLRKFVTRIANTTPDEIACEDCYEHMNRFADMLQAGEDPAIVMPLVQQHLDMCNLCGEEFEALVEALEAVTSS